MRFRCRAALCFSLLCFFLMDDLDYVRELCHSDNDNDNDNEDSSGMRHARNLGKPEVSFLGSKARTNDAPDSYRGILSVSMYQRDLSALLFSLKYGGHCVI